MSNKNRVIVQNTLLHKYNRKHPHNHADINQSELKALSERSNSVPDRMINRYSQVRLSQDPSNPADFFQQQDDSQEQPAQNPPAQQFDPAFQNVLDFLKIKEENEGQLRARLQTFGEHPDFHPPNPLDPQQPPKSRKTKARHALRQITSELRKFIESFRQNFLREQKQFKQLLVQVANLYNPISHSTSVQNSLCQSVHLPNDALGILPEAPLMQSKFQEVATVEYQNRKEELERLTQTQRTTIENLELKFTEIDARNKLTIVRLENQNKLLNLELGEVMKRFQTERKVKKSQDIKEFMDQRTQEFEELKRNLSTRQAQISTLRAELNKQYDMVQMLIRNIFQLEENSKDNPSNVSEKDLEIDRLSLQVTELDSQLRRIKIQYDKLKSESYAVYEENFCLQQKVESFEIELAEKDKSLRKQLQKESKTKVISLELQNDRLVNHIAQLTERLSKIQDRNSISQSKGESKVRDIDRKLRINTELGSVNLVERSLKSPLIRRQNSVTESPRCEFQNEQQPSQQQMVMNHRPPLPRGQPPHRQSLTYKRPDSLERSQVPYQSQRQTPNQSPHDYAKKTVEQYRDPNNDSLFYKTQPSPVSFRVFEPVASPRAQINGSFDYFKRNPTEFGRFQNGQSEILKRKNSYRQAELKEIRSRSKDKVAEFSTLKMQLNNLTNQLKSQMAQVSRRAK